MYDLDREQTYPLGGEDRFRVFRDGTYRSEDLKLQRLENLENWRVAEGEPDIRGWTIVNKQDESLGQVEALIVSPVTRDVYFLIAQVGGMLGLGGKHVLVPLDRVHLQIDRRRVEIDTDRDHLQNAAEYTTGHDIDYAQAYRYWEGRVAAAPTERREMAGVAGGEAPAAMAETTVPLREEELVARREKHTGEVDIQKHVVTEQRTIEVPVTHTEVEVERRPVTGEARYHTEGSVSESEVRIPVTEEEVHIEKRPVVKEEIVVRQHPETETEAHTETIRRETVEVHEKGDVDVQAKGGVDVKRD